MGDDYPVVDFLFDDDDNASGIYVEDGTISDDWLTEPVVADDDDDDDNWFENPYAKPYDDDVMYYEPSPQEISSCWEEWEDYC